MKNLITVIFISTLSHAMVPAALTVAKSPIGEFQEDGQTDFLVVAKPEVDYSLQGNKWVEVDTFTSDCLTEQEVRALSGSEPSIVAIESACKWGKKKWLRQFICEALRLSDSKLETLDFSVLSDDALKLIYDQCGDAVIIHLIVRFYILGKMESVKSLIKTGVDVNQKVSKEDVKNLKKGDYPLNYAIRNGDLEAAKVFVDAGARLDLSCYKPLVGAAQLDSIDMADYLLSVADKAGVYCYKLEALMLAIRRGNINTAMVFVLNDKSLVNRAYGNDDTTPLMLAAKEGPLDLVKFLVFNGADPKHSDLLGKTALGYAKEGGHQDIVLFLH
jgi:hypothetical protein